MTLPIDPSTVLGFDPIAQVPLLIKLGTQVTSALLTLIIGWWLAGVVEKTIRKILSKTPKMDPTLYGVIGGAARYAILTFVIIAVLNKFGVQTASIIAVLGALGLAIGLALQGTLSNIAAGVVLLMLRPMKVGEVIAAEGIEGTVIELGLFMTAIRQADGAIVFCPNSKLSGAVIKNMSRKD
jgi:small conductance mechanosensitive channel